MSEAKEDKALPDASKGWGLEEFKLKHPFKFAGVDYRKFDVRVPTGHDIEAYVRDRSDGLRKFALMLVDADAKVLDAAHGSDYARLLATVGEYLAGVR